MKFTTVSLSVMGLLVAFPSVANASVATHTLLEDDVHQQPQCPSNTNVADQHLYAKLYDPRPDFLLSQTQTQKTVECPVGESTQDLYERHVQYGARTRFILKNSASEPVSVAFVDRNHAGQEVSAANVNIVPASSDPESVLQPGQTKVFGVNEGDVFHVRDIKTGDLLLQHRAGLIPIENRYNQEISCPNEKEDDLQNIGQAWPYRKFRKFQQWKPVKVEPFRVSVDIDVGFHNTVQSSDGTHQCGINLYYVQKRDNNPNKKPQYNERFKLHLGANQLVTAYDTDAWDAETKYERTYYGHEFAARLASNDNVVVDYFAIGPIEAKDCPNKKKQRDAVKSAAHASAIVIPVGARNIDLDAIPNGNETDSQRYFDAVVNMNTTETRRALYFQMFTE